MNTSSALHASARKLRLALIAMLVLLSWLGAAPAARGHPAAPNTFTVTRFDDRNSGSCALGDCSLREAVIAANDDPSPDGIMLPAGTFSLTIPGRGEDFAATGDLDIRAPIVLIGSGAATSLIDAQGIDRVFDIITGTIDVYLYEIALQDGDSQGEPGGGLRVRPYAEATLSDSAILNNHAVMAAAGVYAESSSRLNLANDTIAYNEVAPNGAQMLDILCSGGGILSNGTLALSGSNVISNVVYADTASPCATVGGGIYNGGIMQIAGSTIAYNVSHDAFFSPTIPAWALGGGIFEAGSGWLSVGNSTFSHNLAQQDHVGPASAFGGGLYINSGWTQTTLNNVTITENRAESPSGDAYAGGIGAGQASPALGNTLLAGNHVTGDAPARGPDCLNTLTSLDYNLIGITGGCIISGTVTHNLYGVDARLGPLQDNGGPTWTHALLPGSPAIAHGNNATCAPFDQRGLPRPQGVWCDIGAFELRMDYRWLYPFLSWGITE